MLTFTSLMLLAALIPGAGDSSGHGASCSIENRPAAIAKSVDVDYPDMAQVQHLTGEAIVRVDLSESGGLMSAQISKSTGMRLLDDAALKTVRQMTYAPEIHSCASVSGSYLVEVEFEQPRG